MAETNPSTGIAKSTGLRSYEDYLIQSRKPTTELGKTEFLTLLSAQLQYQDPLEPMTDSAFVAQLAQFSSVEQLTNLNNTMSMFQYYSLAGKYVLAEITLEDGTTGAVSGIVDRVINTGGKAYAQVGDYLIDASKISQVYDKELFTGGNPLLDTASLIGRTVQANVTNEDKTVTKVSGVVTRVAVDNNVMYAYLDDGTTKVAVGDIFDIAQ